MKILITTDCYYPTINGVVTSIINLENKLKEYGHDIRILTLSNTNKSYVKRKKYYIASVNGDVIYPDVRVKVRPCQKILNQIYDWKPDIIHSQSEFSTFRLAKIISRKMCIPLVHTYHTVYEDYTHYFSPSKKIGRKAVKSFTNRISRNCDAFISPTKKVKCLLEDYGVNIPIKVIPTGIDLSRYQKKINLLDITSLRNELNIPMQNRVFISVSRLCDEKNIGELIDFYSKCNNANTTLLIVGDGPRRKELENIASKLKIEGQIKFAGMVSPDKIPIYYALGDVFVSASTSETQGLTYIEALASGTPLLCRKDDCLLDLIEEGRNGYHYETFEAFHGYFDYFSNNLKDTYYLSQYSRNTSKNFSNDNFARKVESLYIELLKENEKNEESDKGSKITYLSSAIFFLCCIISVYAYFESWYSSLETLQEMVRGLGGKAALFFVLSQVIQVVVPIIPGGVGCLAGVILFGPLRGFIYNYIGICIGSILVFGISKNCGGRVINRMFPKQLVYKYRHWTSHNDRFNKLFAWSIFLPIAPDDFLCYLAGTTQMKWGYFTSVILLGKILSIAAYSFCLRVIWDRILLLLL